MELKWLEDFLSLCDSGNFRISAERQCISQPTFSRRIKALEDWMGTQLIDRSGQPVKLTSAGEILKPLALEIVQKVYQSRNEINTQISAAEGKIRFSTLSTLAQFFMPVWLKHLQRSIKTESFSVRTDFGSVDDYLAGLEEGAVDFFISYEDPSKTIVNYTGKFQSLKLGIDSLVAVTSVDDEGNPLYWLPTAKAGSAIPYLHTNSKPSLWPIKAHINTTYSHLDFMPVYETSIASAIRAMVVEGYGVAWIPKSIVADDLKKGLLKRAAEEKDDILMDIKIYRFERNTNQRTEKFWQTLLLADNP